MIAWMVPISARILLKWFMIFVDYRLKSFIVWVKVGSPILYRGEWHGKLFEDKGQILEIEPEKRLVSTHWSPCPVCRTCRKIITRSPINYQKMMGRRM